MNSDNSIVSCNTQNLVYLLSCNNCNQQYVGETRQQLNKRMNTHRTSKSGCEHIVNHKNTCNGCELSIQILENLPGNGHLDTGDPDPNASRYRLDREDFWIKRLRTLFPYGLNEKAFDKISSASDIDQAIGRFFPPLERSRLRVVRNRKRVRVDQKITADQFFQQTLRWINSDIKSSFNNIRLLLNTLPKRTLKNIASTILEQDEFAFDESKEQCFLYILDIVDTKFYVPNLPSQDVKRAAPKNVCVIRFVNKGIDALHLSKIFKLDTVISQLPANLREAENIPTVTFKLDSPIRNKILNYKQTVSSLDITVNGSNAVVNNLPECNCVQSDFCDPHHGHIVTGDLRFIENSKLRKLISKGPNYREPKFVNYNKCLLSVQSALTSTASELISKYDLPQNSLVGWVNSILDKVRERINVLKAKTVHQKVKPILKDRDVILYLENLHSKYVLVPIDKASNNVAIICKKFYIERIVQEIGLYGSPSDTYEVSSKNIKDVISNNIELCSNLKLDVSEKHHSLPLMYWMPKMHYTPSKARFIIASAICSTKPLSKLMSVFFRKIFHQIQNFHAKARFYKNYNRFWVIQNSVPVLNALKEINAKRKAKKISTFDFSTLYTKLPHKDLIKVLQDLVEFVFLGGRKTVDGNRKYLTVKGTDCFFSRTKHGNNSFTKTQIKRLIDHLISETYFTVGNLLLRQCIGIPMGIDPAPFWANLYLYHYENLYITKLIRTDRYKGFKFKNTFRFIDDACTLNDSDVFIQSYKEIYPKELELKCEHSGLHATFLELDITVSDAVFVFKLFDKRDGFPFSIIRMPDLTGNIPHHVFYGSIMSEVLRIARATLQYDHFVPRIKELFRRMISQGASKSFLSRQIDRVTAKHATAFTSFNVSSNTIKLDLEKY